jgi:hypothetical protein
MTDKDFEEITRDPSLDFDIDSINDYSGEYYKEISYIEKQQIETHEKIKEFDILTSVRRGEYKEIFTSYTNYCLEKGKNPEARHLFNIYNDIKNYFTTNIALDAFINICNGEYKYKEFFTHIDFNDFHPDNFSLITGDWKKNKNSNVKITYDKLQDILNGIEYDIAKEIHKIDKLFLEYLDLIEKQKEETTEGKKKALTDDDFKNYKNEYLTPQIITDLINEGQLEQEMINGKYKPVAKITQFMDWLSNNGYEDCLNPGFFKKFIYHKNTEGTIRQYLKPCNYGVKKKRKGET